MTNPAIVPDSESRGLVAALPGRARDLVQLARFDRPIGSWLLFWPGAWAIALAGEAGRRWDLLLWFALGSVAMRGAGCVYNDIVDRDLDRKVARTAARPVASGRVSSALAWGWLVTLSLVGLVVLVQLRPLAQIIALASLALVAAYPFMKRITWWPQAWLGLTFNWGALMGFAAAQDGQPMALSLAMMAGAWSHGVDLTLALPSGLAWPAFLLYGSGVFWTLGYDTIYAVQDIEDDALAGVKSSARRLGEQAPMAVLIFYILTAFLALAAWWTGHLGPLAVPLIAVYAAHLARQPTRLRLGDSAGALALFRSNTLAALILFAAFVAGRFQFGLLEGLR